MEDEDWQTITYDLNKSEVLAEAKDGRFLPLRLLSDGVRNMLAMVADMAYRAAMLNPHLGKDAAKETPGIVLIDEIDLHLHPSWQRVVVEALHRTFPNIQFIATTHSPFIIQSLDCDRGSLINLDPQDAAEYSDKSIEDITENVMGVYLPQKSKRFLKMKEAAKEYARFLKKAKNVAPEQKEKLKLELDKLMMPYSNNPAYHAFLESEREAAGID